MIQDKTHTQEPAAHPSAPLPGRGNILIPKFKAGPSEWARLERMLKDDGVIRRTWARQAAQQAQREAMARQVGRRLDARTKTEDMELLSVMHMHDFLRLQQAQPGFFKPGEVKANLKYLRKRADIPIFV